MYNQAGEKQVGSEAQHIHAVRADKKSCSPAPRYVLDILVQYLNTWNLNAEIVSEKHI